MKPYLFYVPYNCAALTYTEKALAAIGYPFIDHPSPDITHILLPVPTKVSALSEHLAMLPKDITIIGGNLTDSIFASYQTIDLLQSDDYLAQNAAITAHCAIKIALSVLPRILSDCPVLVVGWGRIGKCLAQLLRRMGAQVTVAARKGADRAVIQALGFRTTAIPLNSKQSYRVVFNTAPAPIFFPASGREDCLKIELASSEGLTGNDIVIARGLPGKEAPESSGQLIAQTIHQILNHKE